jgi:hypothetical protein
MLNGPTEASFHLLAHPLVYRLFLQQNRFEQCA